MKILVLNCGSSSLKFQLIDMTNEERIVKGNYERIGGKKSALRLNVRGNKEVITRVARDYDEAIKVVLKILMDEKYSVISSLDEISAVGHRIVHGGEKFSESALITEEVIEEIEQCIDLAPLHNPAGVAGIRAAQKAMPGKPMVVVFDTAFHQTMPQKAFIYQIPYKYYGKYKIRKYGFHGTSHRFINDEISKYLNRNDLKVISCHIGSGASLCAIDSGRVVDTSMGFSPITGIMMGTRPGDVDPSIIEYVMDEANISLDEVMTSLNKKSGLEGVCGKSDSRDVEDGIVAGDEKCILAQDMYTWKVANYVAQYNNMLNGADVIVLTAGLGENSKQTRKDILDKLASLGIKIDEEKNNFRGEFRLITTPDSKIPVYVIPTNEELMIARDTYSLVK